MLATGRRNFCRAAIGTIAAGFMFATLSTGQAQAATVDEFIANPAQVLAQYPSGSDMTDLIALIRDVATSRPGALQTIIGLLATATTDQQTAIGSGLGQAYQIVLNTDQAYAAQIAAAIANSNSDDAKTAYAAITGDVTIAATGGGGGGGGGGSGGPTGTGGEQSGGSNTGGETTGFNPTDNPGTTFTGGGGGTSSSSGSTESVSAR